MIPLNLRLRNFLSYREAELSFEGLGVACLSGVNGGGNLFDVDVFGEKPTIFIVERIHDF